MIETQIMDYDEVSGQPNPRYNPQPSLIHSPIGVESAAQVFRRQTLALQFLCSPLRYSPIAHLHPAFQRKRINMIARLHRDLCTLLGRRQVDAACGLSAVAPQPILHHRAIRFRALHKGHVSRTGQLDPRRPRHTCRDLTRLFGRHDAIRITR